MFFVLFCFVLFCFFVCFFFTYLYCLIGCLSMIVWTHAVLGVLHACVLYFCICTCSAQLSMFHVERRYRNTLIIITIIKVIIVMVEGSIRCALTQASGIVMRLLYF